MQNPFNKFIKWRDNILPSENGFSKWESIRAKGIWIYVSKVAVLWCLMMPLISPVPSFFIFILNFGGGIIMGFVLWLVNENDYRKSKIKASLKIAQPKVLD